MAGTLSPGSLARGIARRHRHCRAALAAALFVSLSCSDSAGAETHVPAVAPRMVPLRRVALPVEHWRWSTDIARTSNFAGVSAGLGPELPPIRATDGSIGTVNGSAKAWSSREAPMMAMAARSRGSVRHRRRRAHSEPLQNIGQTQYLGVIGLGNPIQQVSVIMDTGSSDLWVKPEAYSPFASTTADSLGETVTIAYSQGSVAGTVFDDTVELCGVTLNNTRLISLNAQTASMATIMAGGVLGLAFTALSHTGDSVLRELERQAEVRMFGLMLTATETGSYLTLGLPPRSFYVHSSLVWTPAVTGMWWALSGHVKIDRRTFYEGVMLLDSGTSFITTPSAQFPYFLRRLLPLAALNRCTPRAVFPIVCPCDVAGSMRPLKVVVGGRMFRILAKQLFTPISLDGSVWKCLFEVMPTDGQQGHVILGDTFLRGVLALFDARRMRIGLAHRQDTSIPELPQVSWIDSHRGLLQLLAYIMLTISAVLFLWPYIVKQRHTALIPEPIQVPYQRAP